MDEAARLQEQIDYWQGRINDHFGEAKHGNTGFGGNWAPHRGSPYGVRRGRGPSATSRGYRNRSLVVRKPASESPALPTTIDLTQDDPVSSTDAFVSTTGRHRQLINSNIYDRVTQQRSKDVEQTQVARREARAAREAARLKAYFGQPRTPDDAQIHELDIEGVRFRIADGGSKLIKASTASTGLVPRKTSIGGVTFFRSKHGNLYRAGMVKPKRWVADTWCEAATLTIDRSNALKSTDPCVTFSTTGTCRADCRFTHDPQKVAICKDFLQKGSCAARDYCDLSHDPTPQRSPACIHFLRGRCTKEECRYSHVKVNPGAPVCRAFATFGFCEKGAACFDRHVTECPAYSNKGVCHNRHCRLPHVDRAGLLRKAPEEQISSDVSSDEDDHSDLDSDEDVFVQADGSGLDLTDNQDFVHL